MAAFERVQASQRTDVGRVRPHNEDFVGCWVPSSAEEQRRHGWLYVVADGVGGAEAGEVASRHATEQVIAHFLADPADDDESRITQAVQAANDDVRALAAERGNSGYMATTMVAVHLRDGEATIANVGDSRCYHWHANALRQVTKDQSLVARLVEEGAITEAEALVHPRRNVILSSLGSSRQPQIDLFWETLDVGDKLLLCSDGLTRHVSDEEIGAIIAYGSVEEATATLIDLANERGGVDNISVTLLEWAQAVDAPATAEDEPDPVSAETAVAAAPAGYSLWVYTFFLALVQCILIIMIWWWLRAPVVGLNGAFIAP